MTTTTTTETTTTTTAAISLSSFDNDKNKNKLEAVTSGIPGKYCIDILKNNQTKPNDAGVFKILYELSKRTGLGISQLANN
jgi:hypothetical protein